jgi:hypothetical protein
VGDRVGGGLGRGEMWRRRRQTLMQLAGCSVKPPGNMVEKARTKASWLARRTPPQSMTAGRKNGVNEDET